MNQLVVGLGLVESEIVQPILGADITYIQDPSSEDLERASGAIVRANFKFDKSIFEKMKSLKVIARTGVGVELVDIEEADRRRIPVVITPGSNSIAVAEGTFSHLLALCKRLKPLTTVVQTGKWDERSKYPVGDLQGSTLGIIGYGRIGKKVAEYAQVFGMKVLAYDPFTEVPSKFSSNFETVLKNSHFLTLHIPLTNEHSNIINTNSISLMRDGVVIVNCSRGGLVQLDDALEALNSGKISGLGLDSFDIEPPKHHPIFDHENVILTPHVMGLSINSTIVTYQDAARGVRDVLEGNVPKAIANLRNG